MRYLILKGEQVDMNQLPAKLTREEAESEVKRLEENRAARNKRAEEYRNRAAEDKYRGGAFMHTFDTAPYSIKEIE